MLILDVRVEQINKSRHKYDSGDEGRQKGGEGRGKEADRDR